jgi:hypothetical protein
MSTRKVDIARPVSGGANCTCEGPTCESWCGCEACEARLDNTCLLAVGTTFTEIVCELVQTMSDDNCGDLVFTGVHQDDDERVFLVFDTAPDAPPADRPVPVG